MFISKTKSSDDYHNDMNSQVFTEWFLEKFLPFLKPNSVIVMDNAKYHSVILNKCPNTQSKKGDILKWLKDSKIPHDETLTRAELLEIVKLHKPQKVQYELDTAAAVGGHTVVRLPPYFCQYNPIELVWSQVKGYVAQRNNTFKMSDVERLTHEAIDSISVTAWADCVRHAEKLQEEDYLKECARDAILEPIIINMQDSDTENSSSDDSSGVEDLD